MENTRRVLQQAEAVVTIVRLMTEINEEKFPCAFIRIVGAGSRGARRNAARGLPRGAGGSHQLRHLRRATRQPWPGSKRAQFMKEEPRTQRWIGLEARPRKSPADIQQVLVLLSLR